MKTFKYSLDGLEIQCSSVVDSPAIEENVDYFESQEFFQSTDTHIVGPAVICNKPILRLDSQTGEPYYIVFDEDVCDFLTKQILSRGISLSADHNGVLLPAVLTGCFQVSPFTPYKNLPNHSIILTYESSPDVIAQLKSRNGFSIEILYQSLIPLPDSSDFSMLLINSLK